jgi:transposase-like protein
MGKWQTTAEVCREYKIAPTSLRHWLRQNRVPGALKLPNGSWRLPPDAEQHLLRRPDERVKQP